MDQGPLVREEIDAGEKLAIEFNRDWPLKAAFWLKASDEDHRYLYIASDRIEDRNIRSAYAEMLRLTDLIQSPYLDPFRVKLIGGDDPLALAAVEIHRIGSGTKPIRLGRRSFGGLFLDDGYLYPLPLDVAEPMATPRGRSEVVAYGGPMDFEWDAVKAESNARKHGTTFAEAVSAFADSRSVTFDAPGHSVAEARSLTMGLSFDGRLLVVSHTDRGGSIRIISARSASRLEREAYDVATSPEEPDVEDDLEPEYDFRSLQGVVRGKYAAR